MQVPKESQILMLPSLIGLLGSEYFVVHSYASRALERLLSLTENKIPRFNSHDISPYLQQLLEKLFAAFSLPESSENPYVMQCIMRVIQFVGSGIGPATGVCLQVQEDHSLL